MKCMICGGMTLPGTKLCLPCRAALRRARDDTISELLPLPRRLENLAFQHASSGSGRLSTVVSASGTRASAKAAKTAEEKRTNGASLGFALLSAVALTIAMLGFMGARQNLGDPTTRDADSVRPALHLNEATRVSPATLAGEARQNTTLDAAVVAPTIETSTSAPPRALVPVRRAAARPDKAHVPTPRPAPRAEVVAVVAVPEKKIATAPPAVRAVERAPILDRWQLLVAGLGRCAGHDLFARGACEHLARVHYCEGYWGQVAMCPGGIGNDHGQ
jgi:hypothetical protein